MHGYTAVDRNRGVGHEGVVFARVEGDRLGEVPGELRQCGLGRAQCDHALPGPASEASTEIVAA